MPATLKQPSLTTPDKSLVSVRPSMAKATIPDNAVLDALSSVVKDAAKSSHGKQGAAAAVLGKDEGNFARDVSAGRTTLTDMAKLGPEFLATFGASLLETYGPLATPKARARQRLKDIRTAADELDQLLEFIA